MSSQSLRIVSWNVNSLRTRLSRVLDWLDASAPDVLCLQETKLVDEKFPREEFEQRGYKVEAFGQKTYNGVALISKHDMHNVRRGLPGDGEDAQRRLIAADVAGIHIINLYVPNGQAVGTDKFAYKLEWLGQLRDFLESDYSARSKLLLCGDFNIAPDDRDVWDPAVWRDKVLFSDEEHAALERLMSWGLTDALRLHTEDGGQYTWWDYRGGAFRFNHGLRIDLFLVTHPLVKRCTAVEADRNERKVRKNAPDLKPSDHVPVTATFTLD